MSVITVNHLSHTYDGVRRAVDDVSFDVQAGEIFGLLGPNGSGKTTIVRVLATMLAPGGGAGRIKGGRHIKYPEQTQRLTNLQLTLLNKLGIPTEAFGDSTGEQLKELTEV